MKRFYVICWMQRSYVVYPPEGPRPPTAEEIQQLVDKALARK